MDICRTCGLCCNGSLFDIAKAEPGEIGRIRALGLEAIEGDRPHFKLPCRYTSSGGCGIYEERFTICRSFRCRLLRRIDAGEVSEGEALQIVAVAKAMLAKAEPSAPLARRKGVHESRAQWQKLEDPAERMAAARHHLELLALEEFLNKHFRNSSTARLLEASSREEPA